MMARFVAAAALALVMSPGGAMAGLKPINTMTAKDFLKDGYEVEAAFETNGTTSVLLEKKDKMAVCNLDLDTCSIYQPGVTGTPPRKDNK